MPKSTYAWLGGLALLVTLSVFLYVNKRQSIANPHPMIEESVSTDAVEKRLKLGDRFYIRSVLLDIFGPQSQEIVTTFVFKQAAVFGGPCDYYDQVRIGVGPTGIADQETVCPMDKYSFSLPASKSANILRQAYTTRVCERLMAESKCTDFAFKQIFRGSSISPPDRNSLSLAFQLFHPERTPNEAVLKALEKIGSSETDMKKRWSGILLSLCIDPSWQLI